MECRKLRRIVAAALALSPALIHAQTEAVESTLSYTVEPGSRVSDIVWMLAENGIPPEAFLETAARIDFPHYPFVPPRQWSLSRFEGLFPPGLYHVDIRGASPESAALMIVSQLLAAGAERFARLDPKPPAELYTDLILASIVQKEAAAGRDYGDVASVFSNRMKAGMTLSSCPAVEYGLGYHRPFLLRSDIRIDTPYNLYLHKGLPPTPIAVFTDDALLAAAHPPATAFYFFTFDWVKRTLSFNAAYEGHRKSADESIRNYTAAYGEAALSEKQPGMFYQDMHLTGTAPGRP